MRPAQILVLSYSRSAVKALIQRIRAFSEKESSPVIEELRFLSVRTFDSWCFRMLRFLGFPPSELLGNRFNYNIELLIKEFKRLGASRVIAETNLNLGNIRHFIIDEYQDLSGIRSCLVKQLLQILVPTDVSECGFTILGDPNQAIYDWAMDEESVKFRYTSRELIEWIESEYSSLVSRKLSKNHRSNKKIDDLIKKASITLQECEENDENPVLTLRDLLEETGGLTTVNALFDKLSSTNNGSLAVLCRGNGQIFELAADIQYQSFRKKKPFTPLKLISGTPPKTLPAWIAVLFHRNKADHISKYRFVEIFKKVFPGTGSHLPCNGDAEAVWKLLLGYARLGESETSLNIDQLRERILWLDSLPDDEGESDKNFILTTIHQSKGLEYDDVKIVYGEPDFSDGDSLEEGRVLFVGISRARSGLNLLEQENKRPFYLVKLDEDRERWHRWLPYGIYQVELGCEGDLNEESIIRSDLMGGEDIVKETQKFLMENQNTIIGKEVVLKKTSVGGRSDRFLYKITFNDGDREYCLGFLKRQVTLDLWSMRGKNKSLPQNIYNLRVSSVTTCTTTRVLDHTVPSTWHESRFWLAVCIHGVGQCKG